MIDDVQFIMGKTSVEEELFHTFNDVFAAGKKIILSVIDRQEIYLI